MMRNYFFFIALMSLQTSYHCGTRHLETLPFISVSELPLQSTPPDPLVFSDGTPVATVEEWERYRRPQIASLFADYVYGHMPPAPGIETTLDMVNERALNGAATMKQLTLRFGPEGTPPIHLLLLVPNAHPDPAPVFLGLNFYGNHSVLADALIPLSTHWIPERASGVENNRATEEARGSAVERWQIEALIDRGYAVATFYHADVDPDKNDFSDGVHPHFEIEGTTERTDKSWGTLAAWAWGLHRAVDYLVTDPDIDPDRIAVMGHSRNGKAALLAGATDERIAMVVSNQSGCGGAAISRRRVGETVQAINTNFPHWFNKVFRSFNDEEDRLPIDQHSLIALIAPRPVLVASAVEDQWADPEGEFEALKAAEPVYKLYRLAGLNETEMPVVNTLVGVELGYHIRPGGHAIGAQDWSVFVDFAEAQMK